MSNNLSRRRFLALTGVAGTGIALAPKLFGQAAASDSLKYTFVNKTNGKFTDAECFWSLDNGDTWHSFAKEPAIPCPKGTGRLYFRLGDAPKNFDDNSAYWDFIEYAYVNGTWNGNTTQVDGFCLPITIALGDKKMGIAASRAKIFENFRKQAPKEFKACVLGDFRIVSPCRAGFNVDGPSAKYFDQYLDEIWAMYAKEKPTPSGKWMGKVVDGALTFTPVGGGKSWSCARKPTTQEVLLGSEVLATNPQFCAAANRHVLADPADWNVVSKYYQAEPCNWYSKFLHEQTVDHKCYGFCYDDVNEQAAFFSGKGDQLIVTLYWDSEPAAK